VADDRPGTGLLASLKHVLATLIALVQARVELVSVEIEEQIAYAASLLLWSIVAIFCVALTLLLLAVTIIIACWDQHRLLASGLVTGAFALLAVIAIYVMRVRLQSRPRFLSATADELRRDVAALDRDPS
jgi:uncharacterized membrane protein YqjE